MEGSSSHMAKIPRLEKISTLGTISSSVLFACTVPFLCCLFVVLSFEPTIRRPNFITWGIILIMFFSGSAFTIFLSVSAYREKSKWLKGVRNEFVSQTPRIIFFWLFGFLCIIYSALNMSININCLINGGNEPFPGEKILSTLSHVIEIAFFTSQLGFVTYFANFTFHSSVVLNFGMCMLLITHLSVWWYQSVMPQLLRHNFVHTEPNYTLNDTDCYWTSDINKFRMSLCPYFSPLRTEYCLLATTFLLRMWHGSDTKNNQTGNESHRHDSASGQRGLNEQTPLIQSNNITISRRDHANTVDVLAATTRDMPVSAVKDSNRNTSDDKDTSRNHNYPKALSFYGVILSGFIIITPAVVIVMILMSVWKTGSRRLLILEILHLYNKCWHGVCLILLYIGLRKQCFVSCRVYKLSTKGRILILSAAGSVAYLTFTFLAGIFSKYEDIFLQFADYILVVQSVLCVIEIYFQTVLIIYSGNSVKKKTRVVSCYCGVENMFLMLLIANASEWFFDSFFFYGIRDRDILGQFYNKKFCSVINEVFFPFVIFYRFHSFMDMYERYQQFIHYK